MAKEVIIDGIKYIPEPPTPSNDIQGGKDWEHHVGKGEAEGYTFDIKQHKMFEVKEDTKVFEWTDELVLEYGRICYVQMPPFSNTFQTLIDFKERKSKQKLSPQSLK